MRSIRGVGHAAGVLRRATRWKGGRDGSSRPLESMRSRRDTPALGGAAPAASQVVGDRDGAAPVVGSDHWTCGVMRHPRDGGLRLGS